MGYKNSATTASNKDRRPRLRLTRRGRAVLYGFTAAALAAPAVALASGAVDRPDKVCAEGTVPANGNAIAAVADAARNAGVGTPDNLTKAGWEAAEAIPGDYEHHGDTITACFMGSHMVSGSVEFVPPQPQPTELPPVE